MSNAVATKMTQMQRLIGIMPDKPLSLPFGKEVDEIEERLSEVHRDYLAFYNEHDITILKNCVFFTKPLVEALNQYLDRINEVTDLIQNPSEYDNPHGCLKEKRRPLIESFAAVQFALAEEINENPF